MTNTFAPYEPLIASDLSAALFRELLGFAAPDPAALVAAAQAQIDTLMPIGWLRPSIVPHAPYSVSPALFRAIAAAAAGRPISVHLGESAQEVEFLEHGTGEWRALLEALGVWTESWTPPGCGPVEYLDRLGLISERLLAVHGVQFDDEDISRLRQAGATIVACPRSNRWTGAGEPPVDRFYASGVRVAMGTDSLASVGSLNLFEEMTEVRRLAPGVAAAPDPGQRDARRRRGAWLRPRARDAGARQARTDDRGTPAGGRRRCGRISAGRHRSRRRHLDSVSVSRLKTYFSFVRFSHSVFALPFALTGAVLALRQASAPQSTAAIGTRVAWIVAAMVAARSAAMGFNRLVDARFDAVNPRTSMRELPRGAMTRREAIAFVAIASLAFIGAAFALGPICFWLSPVALAIVFWYSLAKRYTAYTQLFLALAMAVAPVGGWLAAGGPAARVEPWLLGGAIGLWVGGFDILYACQDLSCDIAAGLKSIPVRFGVRRSLLLSRLMHVAAVVCLALLAAVADLGRLYLVGVALVAGLLVYEQSLVREDDLSQVKRAFDLNGYVGILYFATTAVSLYVH